MDLLTHRDELAAVIAHEMAHVLARHSAEAMTSAVVTLPLRIGAALMFESGTGVFDAMHNVLVALPASRAAEGEADAIGMQLAARACYKPAGMINMLSVRPCSTSPMCLPLLACRSPAPLTSAAVFPFWPNRD